MPYSEDLLSRVASLPEKLNRSVTEVARLMDMSPEAVHAARARRLQTGSVAAAQVVRSRPLRDSLEVCERLSNAVPYRHGPALPFTTFTDDDLSAVRRVFAAKPTFTLNDVVDCLRVQRGRIVCLSTAGRMCEILELTVKFRVAEDSRAIPVEQEVWVADIWRMRILARHIIAVAEASTDDRVRNATTGRAPKGRRLASPCKGFSMRGELYSVTNALSLSWLLSADVVLGAADSDTFANFMAGVIVPRIRPFPESNSVVVLDDCRINNSEEWIELVHERGGMVIFLPAHSPSLNPAEMAINLMKDNILRLEMFEAFARKTPAEVVRHAAGMLTPADACHCFDSCSFSDRNVWI